jgi:uncharacterized peroxidase-related enzyme
MAWIETIDEDDASESLRAVYDRVASSRGKVANILKVHSLRPKTLQAHHDLYRELLFARTDLSRAERELIAVVVSDANDCAYCVEHHRAALNAYWDNDRIDAVLQGEDKDVLSEREQALAAYARALTTAPSAVTEDDVAALRDKGLSDTAILDTAMVTSYFNFVNRMALGLGVNFTPEEVEGYAY